MASSGYRAIWRRACGFAGQDRGNAAITLALAAIPLMAIAGGALDYSRMSGAQARVQAVLDSATMAAAASKEADVRKRTDIAARYFAENYQSAGTGNTPPIASFALENGVLKGEVKDFVKTSLLPLMGINHMDFMVKSEVRLQTFGPAEIVLALDYSSSMLDNGKWPAMRKSALKLVDDLTGGANNPNVRFGLVPFAGHVYATMSGAYVYGSSPGINWTNCTTDRKYPYNTQDTTPALGIDDSKWGQDFNSYKSACVNYLKNNLVIRRLTSDAAAVKQQLNAMVPYQGTHIALGLEFARHVLSPNEPFNDGAPYKDKIWKKVLILLTDGDQHEDGYGPGNNTHNITWAEKNTETMCSEAKKQGVLVITIGFDLGNSGSGVIKRLRDCATSPDVFFDARTNSDLASAFDAISGVLVNSPYFQR